ncbi:hypothetical protein D3C78_1700330 [compost metagenome]
MVVADPGETPEDRRLDLFAVQQQFHRLGELRALAGQLVLANDQVGVVTRRRVHDPMGGAFLDARGRARVDLVDDLHVARQQRVDP